MAKIISFNNFINRKAKSSKADDSGNGSSWSYKEQIRSHRMIVFYRLIMTAIVVAVAVVAVYISAKTKTFVTAEVKSSVENHSIKSENMIDFAGTILSYGMDGAACVDAQGNALWNITYEMQNPMVSVQNDMVAIGDFGSRTVYIMNTSGSVGQITTTMPIYKFCISAAKEIAVVLNDTDVTWIYLYDIDGNVIAYFKTTMRQSGFPVDVTISPNGKLVGVSYVYVDSGELRSSVAYYNFGDVGQNETDNYVSGYDYNSSVIPAICFMDNDYAFAVADDRIMFYKGSEKPTSQAEHLVSDEIQKVFYDEKYVALVYYSDQADYRYHIQVFGRNGSIVDEFDCNMEFKDIKMQDDTIYIYSESQCMIFRVGGSKRYDGPLPKSTYLLIPGNNANKFTTVNSESVDTILLK